MDPLIMAARRARAAGDPLDALNRIALRNDPPALALRGIAMARLGDLVRAKALLQSAARASARLRRMRRHQQQEASDDSASACGTNRAARSSGPAP
jgi:hypothetical protein